MFRVYGVSFKKCEEKAKKEIDKLRGKLAPCTADEYQFKVIEKAKVIYESAKPVAVSAELSTPTLVAEYIELAKKSGGFKLLSGMRKTHKVDAKGNTKISKATKKPLWKRLM